ncbi:MAG: IS4 family transposase [Firmicutes bacterium]|nr:IS4 family transposase [Bacillota bacterium]
MIFDEIQKSLSDCVENGWDHILTGEQYKYDVNDAIDKAGKWNQRKCVLNSRLMMWFVFALMLYRSLSQKIVLSNLFREFRWHKSQDSIKAVTPEAACHARERLTSKPIQLFFEAQAAKICPATSFYDLRVYGIDGSAINVPDTPANREFFGCQKTAAYPQMKMTALVETSIRQIVAVRFAKHNVSEKDEASLLLGNIPENSVVILDRGLIGIWFFDKFRQHKCHFLARITSSWNPKILKILGNGDSIVEITAEIPKKHRAPGVTANMTMRMRMIKYCVDNGETIRLLTDLMDEEKYPAREIAALYHERWECETTFDEVKTHLAPRPTGGQTLLFRSKKPDCILQEAYTLCSLHNMVRGLMAEAGRAHNVEPLEISLTETVELIKSATPFFLQAKTDAERNKVYVQLLKDISLCRVRKRIGRSYDRSIKKRRDGYTSRSKDYGEKKTKGVIELASVNPPL